jgi:hypothetical protein
VVAHHPRDVVQHRHGAAIDSSSNQLCTDLRSLLLLVLAFAPTFHQDQLIMKDVVLGAIRHSMGSGQIHAGHMEVSPHIGRNSGDKEFFAFRWWSSATSLTVL